MWTRENSFFCQKPEGVATSWTPNSTAHGHCTRYTAPLPDYQNTRTARHMPGGRTRKRKLVRGSGGQFSQRFAKHAAEEPGEAAAGAEPAHHGWDTAV